MTSAVLGFEGFAQVRLATDPDPADEPRGISGWTHAVAGEPDLDRVIVVQDDDPRRVRRSHGPTVGIAVTRVTVGGVGVPTHPLVGARVELADDPRFEGRNWIIAADGREPIDPFHLRVAAGEIVLEKRDVVADADGSPIPFYLWEPGHIARRMPSPENNAASISEVLTALKVPGAAGESPAVRAAKWRNSRRAQLESDLQDLPVAEVVTATALRRRIADLRALDSPAASTASFRMRFRFNLHGPGDVSAPADLFDAAVDPTADWPIDFWVGGWDADAACMYLRGELTVVLQPR